MVIAPLVDFATQRRIHGFLDAVLALLTGPSALVVAGVAALLFAAYHLITAAIIIRTEHGGSGDASQQHGQTAVTDIIRRRDPRRAPGSGIHQPAGDGTQRETSIGDQEQH